MGKRSRLFKNKRGIAEDLLIEALQLLAVILILTSSFFYVNSKFAKVGYDKAFLSRDFGLLATTIGSAGGHALYEYYVNPVDKSDTQKYKFHAQAKENVIKINATGSPKQSIYWFFSGPSTEIEIDKQGILGTTYFAKEGGKIEIKDYKAINSLNIACPPISTEDAAWRQNKFILDPSHGENADDIGAANNNDNSFFESQAAWNIASRIAIPESNKILTRQKDAYATMAKKESVAAGADPSAAIISIHIGDYEQGKNYIKAYFNANSDEKTKMKSAKLGCSIINAILDYQKLKGREGINGAAVMPSDSEYITRIIPSGRTGILLELGNIQIPKEDNFLTDATHLAEAIYTGIGDYYEK